MVSLVNKKQPIRVDENSPILAKATKVESLCTVDRDYYMLDADSATDAELNNLSLQQSDSLSTTISEESDSIHVYDLNKRETKILRHGIIKLSRNPVGEFDDTHSHTSSTGERLSIAASSPLESTIQQFNQKIFEHAKETRKPPRSPTKLKSVHLNRNPRKFNMADLQLSSEETIADGTNEGSITTKVETSSNTDNNNVETVEKRVETETLADGSVVTTTTVTTEVREITQNLLENERQHSSVAVVTAVERKLSTKNEQEDTSNITVEVTHVEAAGSQEAETGEEKLHEEESFTKEILEDKPVVKEVHQEEPLTKEVHEEETREVKVNEEEEEVVHEKTVHEEEPLKVQAETHHVEETVHEDEPIIGRKIGQYGTARRLTDAEIIFEKRLIDNDDAAHVEIIPAPTGKHETTRDGHGNTTEVIRENQLEVVIVSPTRN